MRRAFTRLVVKPALLLDEKRDGQATKVTQDPADKAYNSPGERPAGGVRFTILGTLS
jgi:hypothetical protein